MSHQITTQPSGHQFSVEAGESILDAALRHGYNFPYGCRNGACGACKGKCVSGEFAYQDGADIARGKIDEAAGEIILCKAEPRGDMVLEVAEIETTGNIEIKRLPCRVTRMNKLAPDVMQVFVKLPENDRLQFMAGQYIDFILRDGRRRSFSLANAPHQDEELELHIRHIEHGEFTDHVFRDMKEKELLRIEGPLGSFFLREDSSRPIIFLAGGTGFAPIKGIIEHTLAQEMTRPIHLYWGARAKSDLYLHEMAQSWAQQHEHIHYIPVLSEPRPEDQWQGRTGFVHDAVLADFADLSGYEVYAGGPPPMVNAAHDGFIARGLNEAHFFSDAFEYAADKPNP